MKKNKLNIENLLSEQMAAVLKFQSEQLGDAFATENITFEKLRENYTIERKFWNEGGPVMHKTLDTKYKNIPIRFYYPIDTDENTQALVYIHGGGFVVGNLDTHDRIMRLLAEISKAVVIGIDYGLSPENKFPKALEECASLVRHLHESGADYKIDKDKISIGGDSGGANLSLATALYLRDNDKDISYIKSLLLYYGAFGLNDSISRRLYGGDYDGLKKEDLDYYGKLYLEKPSDIESHYYSCLGADLTYGIPACYIESGDLDPLCDDSIALYKILNGHDIKCELNIKKGLIHAYLHYSKMLDEACDSIKRGSDFLNRSV